MKNFIFMGDTLEYEGRIIHRIVCVKEFGNVSVGDLGEWIEKESNLSDNAWVYSNAQENGLCVSMFIQWNITITKNHIKIGCQQHEIEEWQDFLDANHKDYNVHNYSAIKSVIDFAKNLKKMRRVGMTTKT